MTDQHGQWGGEGSDVEGRADQTQRGGLPYWDDQLAAEQKHQIDEEKDQQKSDQNLDGDQTLEG